MAEDKKDDKHEEGGEGKQDFAVIPMKYLTPIVIILILVGTGMKILSPDLASSLGPTIGEPFVLIMAAYVLIIFAATVTGQPKTASQIFGSLVPMLVLAILVPTLFGYDDPRVYLLIVGMMFVPFLGNWVKKYLTEKMGVGGFEEEKHEPTFDIKDVKEAAIEIKKQTAIAKSAAERERGTLGSTYGDTYNALKKSHGFAHYIMKKKEKDLKKEGEGLVTMADQIEVKIREVDEEIYTIREPLGDNVKGKTLQKLLDALDEIKARLSVISNSLSASTH